MTSLSQLETYTNELATAAKTLAKHCRDASAGSTPHLAVPTDAPFEIHRTRRNALAIITQLRTLLAEPIDFIQHLASQVRRLFRSGPQSRLTV